MSAMKDTFSNRETSEEQLLNDLSNVDLLVIDEIGVRAESRYEKVIIASGRVVIAVLLQTLRRIREHSARREMNAYWVNASWTV